jgi:biopolymer transport protein ExbB
MLGSFRCFDRTPLAAVAALTVILSTASSPGFAEDPPAAAAEAAAAEAPVGKQSIIAYCFNASPVFFILMLLVSILMVYLSINGFMRLQVEKIIPPQLVGPLDGMLTEKKYKEAYEMVKVDSSPLGKALAAGIERLNQGYDRGLDALLGSADDSRMELEHAISPINLIAAVAPMVGLLGTVLGMIFAFQKIGLGSVIKPAVLAGDIGLALVSTLEGLLVAIPAIVVFSFLRNRVARLSFEVETVGESYLVRFASALKKQQG